MIQVYCHTSPSGKQYVGIASGGWRSRWRSHVFEARRGSALPLHRAINKYGPEAFQHQVLEQCGTREDAEAAEKFWILALGTKTPAGYNATDGGEGVVGLSSEARARMRRAHLGKAVSSETIARMSKPRPDRRIPHSSEHRARISAAHLGKRLSAEARDKLRAANLGKRQSDETKAKRAASMRAAWARRSEAERAAVGAKITAGKFRPVPLRIAPAWRSP